MGFVNRRLDENEVREYILEYPRNGEKVRYKGGTIDTENDVRLFCYANGPIMEPSDIYSFIFDYKRKVFFINLRQELSRNDVHWYSWSGQVNLNEEQLQSLRKAIKVYAYDGFSVRVSAMEMNDSSNVYVEF